MVKSMDPKANQAWLEFLNPEVTRPRLIAASVYVAGFEVLRDSIVGRIRDFFSIGFDESGDRIDPRYESDVLSRNRSPVYASLGWMEEMKAIDEHDMEAFERVKACRNILAHELFRVATAGLPANFEQCFTDMLALLRKIEVWWITNVEIPTNPDFDGSDVEEDEITPGPVIAMRLLLDIALGDGEQSEYYLKEFLKQARRSQ